VTSANSKERAFARPVTALAIGLGNAGEVAGGAERVFAELEKYLPACGVQVCATAVSQSLDAATDRARRHVFSAPDAGIRARLTGARRVVSQLLETEQIHLVASHFALYSLPALDRIASKPFVVHFHGPWSAESIEEGSGRLAASAKYLIERLVYTRADRVIVLSRAFAHLLAETYAIPEDRICIVPGSVDIERFAIPESRRQAREILGWPMDRPILVTVRRLTHRMGIDLLIDAMPRIVARYPEVLLHICGQGELRPELEQRVRNAGLETHVQFLGFVSEEQLPLVYRAADFNIVPTRAWEGFGLVAAEAVAAGTPSVVTPVGGLPEVIATLAPELVLRSATGADIAEGIVQALSGSASIPDAETCRAYAAQHFSSRLMAERTAAIYRELF
jgi:glycosyltransferase involved in cell wall biosynthesis